MNKKADEAFIHKVINMAKSKYNLKDYVKGIDIKYAFAEADQDMVDGKPAIAYYNHLDGTISLSTSALDDRVCELESTLEYMNLLEINLFINLYVAHILLHEMEHARQDKIVNEDGDKTLEGKLLGLTHMKITVPENFSYIDYDKLGAYFHQLYNDSYEFNPAERMADINSYRTVLATIQTYRYQLVDLYDKLSRLFFRSNIRGYEEAFNRDMCPTQAYLSATGRQYEWKDLDIYHPNQETLMRRVLSQYGLNDRMYYGLPITVDEYNAVDDMVRGN